MKLLSDLLLRWFNRPRECPDHRMNAATRVRHADGYIRTIKYCGVCAHRMW